MSEEQPKEPNLADTLRSIDTKLEGLIQTKQLKDFRVPQIAKVGRMRSKKNWVTIAYIRENNTVRFMRAPIEEGVIVINGRPHVVNNQYVMTYKNRPLIIQAEWSSEPFNPHDDRQKAQAEGRSSQGWKTLALWLESEKLQLKKKMGIGIIILLLAIIGGAAYYLFGSGGTPA